jgi:hypothetical protein
VNLDEQIRYYEEKVRLGEKTYSKASPGNERTRLCLRGFPLQGDFEKRAPQGRDSNMLGGTLSALLILRQSVPPDNTRLARNTRNLVSCACQPPSVGEPRLLGATGLNTIDKNFEFDPA